MAHGSENRTSLKVKVLVAQSCLTLWSVHRILQARILDWATIPFSRGTFRHKDQTQVSCIAGRFLLSEPPGKPTISWVGFNFLGWEDLLEKGMAAHSSILACRIPGTEEPGRL